MWKLSRPMPGFKMLPHSFEMFPFILQHHEFTPEIAVSNFENSPLKGLPMLLNTISAYFLKMQFYKWENNKLSLYVRLVLENTVQFLENTKLFLNVAAVLENRFPLLESLNQSWKKLTPFLKAGQYTGKKCPLHTDIVRFFSL